MGISILDSNYEGGQSEFILRIPRFESADVASQALLLLLEDWFSGSHGGAGDVYGFDDPNNKVLRVRFCLGDRHLMGGLALVAFHCEFCLRGHRR